MIFDFFTARLQRKKYETPAAMSMGFTDFFHKNFTQPLFPQFLLSSETQQMLNRESTLITLGVAFAASGRYAAPWWARLAVPWRSADWPPTNTCPSGESGRLMAVGS
jgi:hypothetical protein